MKFSRNPSSGRVECYNDDGVFLGNVVTMGDMIGNNFAKDGGSGSGNFGHAGRPGKVGGSASNGGGSQSKESESKNRPKSGNSHEAPSGWYDIRRTKSEVKKQQSGLTLAKELREKYDSMPKKSKTDWSTSEHTEGGDSLISGVYRGIDIGELSEKEQDRLFDHYLEVLEYNGNPEKTDKQIIYYQKKFPKEKLLEGIPEKEAQKMENELIHYTGDDWKNADTETIEEFIEKSPVVFHDLIARGIHATKEKVDEILKEAETGVVSFGRVTSWSDEYATAMAFATNDHTNNPIGDDKVPVVFYIASGHSRTGVPISPFSRYREGEVIMSGKCSYSVVSIGEESFLTGKMSDPLKKGYLICLMERGEEYD